MDLLKPCPVPHPHSAPKNLHCPPALARASAVTLLSALLLTACASSQNPAPADFAAAANLPGVPPPVVQKIQNSQPLTFPDLLALTRSRVPASIIEGYLHHIEQAPALTSPELEELARAGAPRQLLSFLAHPAGFFGPPIAPLPPPGAARREYLNTPAAQARQPFASTLPAVDYWYNSAYEESLYSPFNLDGD